MLIAGTPQKQKGWDHQTQVFEKGNLRIQFDEIAKTTAVGYAHVLFYIRTPFGEIEEVGICWHIPGEVGEAGQDRKEEYDQEKQPGGPLALIPDH